MSNSFKYHNALPLSFKVFYADPEYNHYRRLNVINLCDILNKYNKFKVLGYDRKMNILKLLEEGSYLHTLREVKELEIIKDWNNKLFLNIYNTNCYELAINLDSDIIKDNDNILGMLFKGNYLKLGSMSESEMNPNKYIPIIKKIEERTNIIIKKKYSSNYQCPKCNKYKVYINSVQKRSLDENSSEEIACLECGYFWVNL